MVISFKDNSPEVCGHLCAVVECSIGSVFTLFGVELTRCTAYSWSYVYVPTFTVYSFCVELYSSCQLFLCSPDILPSKLGCVHKSYPGNWRLSLSLALAPARSTVSRSTLSKIFSALARAHNCGRSDLLLKPVQDLHTGQYICSDHIDDRFFINETTPIVIAQGAVPTLFGATTRSTDIMDSMKENYRSEREINSPQLTECINVVDRVCQEQTLSEIQPAYREEEETESIDSLHLCSMNVSVAQLQGMSVKLTGLCRICGHSTTDGKEIFGAKGLELRLKEKIELHTPIIVHPDESMPRKICSDCCDKLEVAHSLVVTCLQADMRLRRFLNNSSKPYYDSKFDKLVTTCAREIADEISLNNVVDGNDPSSDAKKIEKTGSVNEFSCKWKDSAGNIDLEQVQICPITETSAENISNFKYVVHSDLNNFLRALSGISPKNDERSNELSETIVETVETDERSPVCPNCNDLFETRDIYESHAMLCNAEEAAGPKETMEVESNIVCPVCRLDLGSAEYLEKHKISCGVTIAQLSCQQCDELFTDKDELELHEMSHNDKCHSSVSDRRCGYCPAVFETRKKLQSHITDTHDGQPLYRCSVCEKTYEKWSNLDVHEATHRADKPYLCDLCGKSFKHSNNLRGHKRTHLDEATKKRHVCEVCGSAFRSRFHLREHANQHNGNRPYTCEECGKAFYKRIQLRQHRLSHGTKKYACPICGVTFNRRGNMNAHMKRHDKSDGMYTCSVCEYKCNSMSELKMHRKQHSESDITESIKLKTADRTVWQCKICDKVFPKRAILSNHERTHTGDRTKVECDKCGKKLASKGSLRYHNKSIHSTERPHMCQFCGDAFVSKEARLIHERIHTGERPYMCKICGMRYRCSSNLSQHMKIHSALRPHVCQYCNKTFSRRGTLNVHERIHTGLKPFVCDICKRSFSQKNDMLNHTKIHRAKSIRCEKCDEVFATKSELLKHLDVHEHSVVEASGIPAYDEIVEPLESYTLGIQCPADMQ